MRVILNWDGIAEATKGNEKAREIIVKILTDANYEACTTDLILVKTIDHLLALKKVELAAQLLERTLGPVLTTSPADTKPVLTNRLDVIRVRSQNIEDARKWFLDNHNKFPLPLSDWITVSVIREYEIPQIFTFDELFDRIVEFDESMPKIQRIG